MADLDDIALQRAERGLITGGSGSGKSTLLERLVLWFADKYPNGRVVVADSKPRFRAEYELTGLKAKRRYAGWDHGTFLPGSVVGDLSQEDGGLEAAWRMNARIVIMQGESPDEWRLILRALAAFYRQARSARPQLAAVDELADYFGANGQPVPGMGSDRDIITRIARSGRERGFGLLAGMQRPKGVPVPVVQELTRLYLFRLDNVYDVERLYDLGVPETITPPTRDREFRYWKRGMSDGPLLRLRLEK